MTARITDRRQYLCNRFEPYMHLHASERAMCRQQTHAVDFISLSCQQLCILLKMSSFVAVKVICRKRCCIILKKSASISDRLLVKAYGDHTYIVRMRQKWFQRFKKEDFIEEDKDNGRPRKKFEDAKLQVVLDADYCQSQQQLADAVRVDRSSIAYRLKTIGQIQKERK